MKKVIDCLFIGHNAMDFRSYEKTVRQMGTDSGAYRDLNLSFIKINNEPLTAGDVFNNFYYGNKSLNNSAGPFSYGNSFSLTIAYLASFIYKRGLTFDYVNSFQEEKDDLIYMLQNYDILTIVIPTTLYVAAFPILEIVSFIKKYNDTAKIIIGGPFVSTQFRGMKDELSKEYFCKMLGADVYINSSQGEAALAKSIYAIKKGLPMDNIDNITFKTNNKFVTNNTSIENNILEENPIEWSLFADKIGSNVAIRTSISCAFSCAFCGFPQHAGKYQVASVEYIEKELNALQRLGKITNVNIIDDTLNVPTERFKDMLRMMIKNDYDFNWNCNFRCQFADEETVSLMKQSKCQGAFLGIESGSDRILKNMNKASTVEKYRKGLSLLNEQDILTYGSFIIGFPGDTEETVAESVKFIEEERPTFFRVQSWFCEPITPIYQEKEKYKINGSQFLWSHATMNSKTAADIVDKLFMTVKNSTWVPQFNCEFYNLFNFLNRGMTVEQIQQFLQAFNSGVKEKLKNPNLTDVSQDTFKRLKNVLDQEGVASVSVNESYNDDFKF